MDEGGRCSRVVCERRTHLVDSSILNCSISRAVHILISLLDAFTKPLTFSPSSVISLLERVVEKDDLKSWMICEYRLDTRIDMIVVVISVP